MEALTSLRLDKWLWTARFFKSRKLATEAITGGKIHVDGQRGKPGKAVKVGQRLSISKGSYRWEVIIMGLSKQRRPASEAVQLYDELPESKAQRESLIAQKKNASDYSARPASRPNKKQRRQIHRFQRQ